MKQGFSFLQAIISLAILSGIFLSAMQIIRDQARLGKNSSADFEIIFLVDEIRSLLANPENCQASLGGKSALKDEVQTLNESLKEEVLPVFKVYSEGKDLYGQKDISIQRMRLEAGEGEFKPSAKQTLLRIDFFKENERGDNAFESRVINIHVNVDAAGVIGSCRTLGGLGSGKRSWASYSAGWEQIPETSDLIYAAGPVLLGNGRPHGRLNVEGDLLVKDSESSCDQTTSGRLRFNPKNENIEGCLKGSWKNLSGVAASILEEKEFSVQASNGRNSTITSKEEFNFCELSEVTVDGGHCWVLPTRYDQPQGPWKFIATHFRGQPVNCKIKCYR